MSFPDISKLIILLREETRLDLAAQVAPNDYTVQQPLTRACSEVRAKRVELETEICTWMLDAQEKIDALQKQIQEQSKTIEAFMQKEM